MFQNFIVRNYTQVWASYEKASFYI